MGRFRFNLNASKVLLGALILTACRTVTPDPASLTSSAPSPGTTAPGASAPSEVGALYLRVDSSWENDDNYVTTLGRCLVPMGSTIGTTLTPADPGCTITVREGQLFFSKLHFIVGTTNPLPMGSTDATLCASVIFRPYYYLASNAAHFIPDWLAVTPASETDCSTNPTPAACYNGPAKTILSGFPNVSGDIFHTIVTQQMTYNVTSGHLAGQKVTKWVANDYAGTSAGISGQDYIAECRNIYFDLLYSISVKITPSYGNCYTYESWDTGTTLLCP